MFADIRVFEKTRLFVLFYWVISSFLFPLAPLAFASQPDGMERLGEMSHLMEAGHGKTEALLSEPYGKALSLPAPEVSVVKPSSEPLRGAAFPGKNNNHSNPDISVHSAGTDSSEPASPPLMPGSIHNETSPQKTEPPQALLSGVQSVWGVMGADDRAGAARSAALGRINGMANGVMNNAIRDWLGQKGNARVQIDTEKRGSADLLVPLVDAQEHLIYGQAGVRRDRDRTIWNGGLGVRYYPAEEFMLGVNSFYDYDQTGNNARYGVGLEARTDYISLSANRYFRITDWHQSVLDSMRDYDERPANGYDLRARYWLPAYPQVGGEFTYEKYFGKGIASGTGSASPDSLRDAPQTFTTAVNYTPFPLMTVTAGHRSGDSSDLFARIDFNWRFGLSLSEQLSADNVSIMRSLKGGRYDLVDRNYNIVMQYRKQELVSLSLPPSFEGEALTSIPVTAKAKAKYGVSRVEWEAGAFVAAGGQIVTGANPLEVSLVLPAWNSPETGKENTYTLTAVMTDREGNKAEARTVITVKASSVQATLSVVSDNALADGRSANQVVVKVTDASGKPVSGMALKVIISPSTGKNECTINGSSDCGGFAATTDASGQVALNITHLRAGQYALSTTLINGNSFVTGVTFVPVNASVTGMTLLATSPVTAGQSSMLTLKVVNRDSAPVTGLQSSDIVLSNTLTGQDYSGIVWTDNGDGSYSASVVMTSAGINTLKANIPASNIAADASVSVTAGAPDAARSSLAAAPATIAADGVAASTLTLTLRDALNNPVSGQAVAFASTLGGVTFSTVTDNGDGSYTATLTGTTAGAAAVSATLGGAAFGVAPAGVTLTGDITGVTAGGYTFAKAAGFPTTGFKGAKFTLNLTNGAVASDYTWTSDASWVSVSNGVVMFTAEGTISPVTITAKPITGGRVLNYTFTVNKWFINAGTTIENFDNAKNYCENLGYSLPDSTAFTPDYFNPSRGIGALWSEWGALNSYSGSGFLDYQSITHGVYRVSNIVGTQGFGIMLEYGQVYFLPVSDRSNIVCQM